MLKINKKNKEENKEKKMGTIVAFLKNNKEKIWGTIAIILIILFAISISPKTLQNDTFYTVSIGKLITENGIDMQDHFSWHEGLPYTYPHWLYDVGMYFIYNLGGWDGIYISTCVLASILGICIYITNSRLSKNKLFSFIITIAVLYLMKSYIAARAQLVTFILFILQIYNIERFLENKKIINAIALIVIHTFIANLHVAVWPFTFVLYLPYIAEYLICEIADCILYKKIKIKYLKDKIYTLNKKVIKKPDLQVKINEVREELRKTEQRAEKIKNKREQKEPYKIIMKKNKNVRWLIVIMIIAVFTGLLTPLGNTPYTYTYLTMKGNTMNNINEHLPLTLVNNTKILCTIVVVLAIFMFADTKIRLSDLFMICGLAYMMFATRRQQSMFVLIGSVAFIRILTDFLAKHIDFPIQDIIKKWINWFTGFVIVAIVLWLSIHFYKEIKDNSYINTSTYPVEASEWILENLDVENIKLFNEYNYGSYLIYKGIPVFIDSRADLYAPEFNSYSGKSYDGNDIFIEFINSSNIGSYYGDTFEKYGITHVLLYNSSKINMLIQKADSDKYKEIYSDDNFVIYEVLF